MIKLAKDKVIPSATEATTASEPRTEQPAPTPAPEHGEKGIKDEPPH